MNSLIQLTPNGYRVLHPTKGWRQVSSKRRGADLTIAALKKTP